MDCILKVAVHMQVSVSGRILPMPMILPDWKIRFPPSKIARPDSLPIKLAKAKTFPWVLELSWKIRDLVSYFPKAKWEAPGQSITDAPNSEYSWEGL